MHLSWGGRNVEIFHNIFVYAQKGVMYGNTAGLYKYFRMTPIFHLPSCVETEAKNERM